MNPATLMSATNPQLHTGIVMDGPNAAVTAPHVILSPKTFTEEELKNVGTHVQLDLPFALHGFTGVRTLNGVRIETRIAQRPKEVAGYNIHLPDMSENVIDVKLVPDNWGYVNFTQVVLRFQGYYVLSDPKKQTELSQKILSACCSLLNPMIDTYCLASKNYAIPRVSPRDFIYYESWHRIDPHLEQYNTNYVFFPLSFFSFAPPETEGDQALFDEAASYLPKGASEYQLAYRLMAEAHRSIETGDFRLAAFHAASTLEVALSYYISTRYAKNPNDFSSIAIGNKTYEKTKAELNLFHIINSVLPTILSIDGISYGDLLTRCDDLRKCRNDAVHDPTSFVDTTVGNGVDAARSLLDLLVKRT